VGATHRQQTGPAPGFRRVRGGGGTRTRVPGRLVAARVDTYSPPLGGCHAAARRVGPSPAPVAVASGGPPCCWVIEVARPPRWTGPSAPCSNLLALTFEPVEVPRRYRVPDHVFSLAAVTCLCQPPQGHQPTSRARPSAMRVFALGLCQTLWSTR